MPLSLRDSVVFYSNSTVLKRQINPLAYKDNLSYKVGPPSLLAFMPLLLDIRLPTS